MEEFNSSKGVEISVNVTESRISNGEYWWWRSEMIVEYIDPYLPKDPILYSASVLGILVVLGFIGWAATQKVISAWPEDLVGKTDTVLDDYLATREVFEPISYLVPAIIFYNFAYIVPQFTVVIERVSVCVIILCGVLMAQAIINGLGNFYQTTKYAEGLNIKSYLQVVKLIIWSFGIIAIISILVNKNPFLLLSGIGAMTAVLLLIFRDTILSLVASIQINSQGLFKEGDWIEVPQFGADGVVIDIALQGVKIENWDKTVSVIPTHKLIESTFKNWRNMEKSGGRRIKRSIWIDMNSISLCDKKMLQKFKKFGLIKEYIEGKQVEIEEYNQINGFDSSEIINDRGLTNIGTFRAYVEAYLRENNNVNENMMCMVRQMEPSEKGLPIQIYVFAKDTNWVRYEKIQADIFDHLLAAVPEFGLRVFQRNTDLGK